MFYFELYLDTSSQWRWRIKSYGNYKILATSGEGYRNRQDVLHAINLIKQNAFNAPIIA